jgi:hypothetical protein
MVLVYPLTVYANCGAKTQGQVCRHLGVGRDWVHFVCRPLTGLLYQPLLIDEYGAVGGMWIGRGTRSTRNIPAPVPLCPPQIPHDLTTWARTRAAAVGSRDWPPELWHGLRGHVTYIDRHLIAWNMHTRGMFLTAVLTGWVDEPRIRKLLWWRLEVRLVWVRRLRVNCDWLLLCRGWNEIKDVKSGQSNDHTA